MAQAGVDYWYSCDTLYMTFQGKEETTKYSKEVQCTMQGTVNIALLWAKIICSQKEENMNSRRNQWTNQAVPNLTQWQHWHDSSFYTKAHTHKNKCLSQAQFFSLNGTLSDMNTLTGRAFHSVILSGWWCLVGLTDSGWRWAQDQPESRF